MPSCRVWRARIQRMGLGTGRASWSEQRVGKGKEDSRLILKEERTVQLVYWNKLGRLKQQCLEDLLMAKLQGLRGLPLTWGYIIVQLWYQGGSSTLATVRLTAWCSPEWLYQRAPTHSFLGI